MTMSIKNIFYSVVALFPIFNSLYFCENVRRPHIIFILADDLGWNDVGFHGSSQIPTPNIDALAYSGVILQNYYVQPLCTPSRSALMTGKYPIHLGMQHKVIDAGEPRGLPLNERLLPQYLKDLGYSTHMVGKWHLGHYKKDYTPLYRGFDSHLGIWSGFHDYYDHFVYEEPWYGLDIRRGMDPAWDLHGQYSTDVFSNEAIKIVQNHNTSKPLFLYMAHAAVHSSNHYNPLPAPDDVVDSFKHIENFQRRKFAAILKKMDDAIGDLIDALSKKDMLKDSIIVFSSDNGGAPVGMGPNSASNWPLRGAKFTLFEGGVRAAAAIWSPLIKTNQKISNQMMHISDWLPTLLSAVNANISIPNLDGVDMWHSLSENTASPRNEILLNIDDIYGQAGFIDGRYKIIKGNIFDGELNDWYGPPGRNDSYDIGQIFDSKTGRALKQLGHAPTVTRIRKLRYNAEVKCPENTTAKPCKLEETACVFDLISDPCERNNLAKSKPQLLTKLLNLLDKYNSTAVPPGNLPNDPRCDPSLWGHTWTNFGDYEEIIKKKIWL
uniref:Putative arylsulfatase b n=1 Tax=Xenopsylla cheopis TaxID=163159 RepID=A0A6M2DJ96_XENCH